MARFLILYLAVTGIGAMVAIAMPVLVVIGMFLILPGLILALMPTAFLWGCAFAGIWFALHRLTGDGVAAVIALAGAAALLWLLPQPSAALSRARLAAAVRPDVVPSAPVVIAGHVRIDVPDAPVESFDPDNPKAPRLVRCNALCAAALFTPGVESVTLNPLGWRVEDEGKATGGAPLAKTARTFRRVPRGECSETLKPADAAGLGLGYEEMRAKEAEWNLRLSTSDCIVEAPLRTDHDIVIARASYAMFGGGSGGYDWSWGPRAVQVDQLEVKRRDGIVLLRKLIARTEALAAPFRVGAGGSLESFHFGWERTSLSNAARYTELDAGKLLAAQTNLAMGVDKSAMAGLVRTRLQAMLADRSVTAEDTGWEAAESYFSGLKGKVTDADRALLPALIRDPRMTKFRGIWDAIRALGPEGGILRAPMVERLAATEDDEANRELISTLGQALDSLPAGIFAEPSAAERALLAVPDSVRARGLVMRQADRGGAAVADLMAIFDRHVAALAATRASSEKRSYNGDNRDSLMIDAVRVALCRLGPQASLALPRLAAIEASGTVGIRHDREWDITLARMGKPIASFDKPENLSGTLEQYRANLQRRLAGFNPVRDCRSNFT